MSTHSISTPVSTSALSFSPLARLRSVALGLVVVCIAACGGGADAPPPYESGTPVAPPAVVAPAITQQPASVTVQVGATASFSIAATGTDPITYQWQRNGVAIDGASGASYAVAATTLADSGATFRAIVTNGAGSATSDVATLTVTPVVVAPPVTTSQGGPCYGSGARGGWCMQNRNPVSVDLLAGSAPTPTTAYAVGGGSIVIKTTDGGTTWQRLRQFDIDTGFCRGLAAPNVDTVYAGCQQGDIIKSTDGGATWTKQRVATNAIMQDVVAHSSNVVWALGLGFGVSRTTDGTNWTKLSAISGNIQHLASPDDSTAFVAVDLYSVARTTDGGATWATTTVGTSAADGEIVAISAPTPAVAWVVNANGSVKRTTDGITWTSVPAPPFSAGTDSRANSLYAIDQNSAYIVYPGIFTSGNPIGRIFHTTDAGTTWTSVRVDTPAGLTRLFASDSTHVWAVGYAGSIFATADQGATWSEQSKGPNLPFADISVVDSNVAWAGGVGPTVSRTIDGANWSYVFDNEFNGAFATSARFTVAGLSATTAFAAGSLGYFIKTVDGGANWAQVTNVGADTVPGTPNTPKLISRAADGTLWTAGDTFVGRSTDSGTSWTAALPPTGTNYLGKIVGINAQVAYLQFGIGGWYRTTDGGSTFQAVPTLSAYLSLVSLDSSTYVAVGLHGTIARSADGGATFAMVSQTVSATGEDLQAVARGSSNVVWAASSTRMLRSDDAGVTWRVQPAPTLELGSVQAMAGIDANTAWAVGYTSGIMKTTDGGD